MTAPRAKRTAAKGPRGSSRGPSPSRPLTRGERVIAFIERYVRVPEGKRVGEPMRLLPFQRRFIRRIYDNPAGTSRGLLSIGRKNGKTGLIAAIALAHIEGPEAVQNSQIVVGARSRDQAALTFDLMVKMIALDATLTARCRAVRSRKRIYGLTLNVEFRVLSADAAKAHGLSPVLAILDEVGQVKGPHDPFVEAIETAQGAYDNPLLLAISTQAATDADLFSVWIDDAEASEDPTIVAEVHTAPAGCDLGDESAWRAANPALGEFRSLTELRRAYERAQRLPSAEASFRWLYLNQRVETRNPFVPWSVWKANNGAPGDPGDLPVYAGLDLSSVSDLTAFVPIWAAGSALQADGSGHLPVWGVAPTFWLPEEGLGQKAKDDRVPWDVWKAQGKLATTPGASVDYAFVARFLWDFSQRFNLRRVGFDRWNFKHLKPYLAARGFSEDQLEGDDAVFVPLGQGFQTMSPALATLEADLLNRRMLHDGHPVLAMCARNAVITSDDAGNRKFSKRSARGRIDGMVALAMARAVAGTYEDSAAGLDDYIASLRGAA